MTTEYEQSKQRIDNRLIALPRKALKFTHEQIRIVARLYLKYGVPLDQLPYTETLERMLTDFAAQTQKTLTLREFWIALMNLRKAGKLGKVQREKP